VGLEKGPRSLENTTEELLGVTKVGSDFANKWRSLGRYSVWWGFAHQLKPAS
jgi:hypothetical protein